MLHAYITKCRVQVKAVVTEVAGGSGWGRLHVLVARLYIIGCSM